MFFVRTVRFVLVGCGAMALTAAGLFAADTMFGTMYERGETLVGRALPHSPCADGMVSVEAADGDFCIDQYEVSTAGGCPYPNPRHERESVENLSTAGCTPKSVEQRTPWRYISGTHAQLACVKVGKRLPTAREWYLAALGTPDEQAKCNLGVSEPVGVSLSGAFSNCISYSGAYDMTGNVWEWVDSVVEEGTLNGRTIPTEGFVAGVDDAGIAVTTAATGTALYGNDRFWSNASGVLGIMRGGYYRSKKEGGLFAVYASSPLSFSGDAVGFRCVKDVAL